MWKTLMLRHGLMTSLSSQPSGSRDGKRKTEGPTREQMDQRKTAREEIKSKLTERRIGFQCRSHIKGRCTNGANCPTPHITDSAQIRKSCPPLEVSQLHGAACAQYPVPGTGVWVQVGDQACTKTIVDGTRIPSSPKHSH